MKRMFGTKSVLGLGYIGLPTAAMFASRKIQVIGVDVNADAVATINRGQIHIVEPDLDIAVQPRNEDGESEALAQRHLAGVGWGEQRLVALLRIVAGGRSAVEPLPSLR